jgi:aryl-alcohol dehydrogenase-like predicted oxidoreductase
MPWPGPDEPVARKVSKTEYTRLGQSGLMVSRIGLGCMSFGQAASGMHEWTLDGDAAAPFFQQAVELGITFWDTANVYRTAPRRRSSARP